MTCPAGYPPENHIKGEQKVCRHKAIPQEDPARVQGPAVGTLCLYTSRYEKFANTVVRVIEASYVWGPGDPNYNIRRYDWKVVDFGTYRLCVDDKDLTVIEPGQKWVAP